MIREWDMHSIAYFIGILRDHSSSVDLDNEDEYKVYYNPFNIKSYLGG